MCIHLQVNHLSLCSYRGMHNADKVERMRAALAWFRGDEHALDSLPDATQ